ncbi:MAG TPA: calcium-binding EGF-like domain-containing protein [bacterium]|nr:calcium-binding EGF-like domain-containing protein [bacterium]
MRWLMITMIVLMAFACDDGSQKKYPDMEVLTDSDAIAAVCGDGTVAGGEVCELDDTADCATVKPDTQGTATCLIDCSGWDTTACVGADECAADPTICGDPEYAACENTDEGYQCTCSNGYIPTSDGKLCVPRYDLEGPIHHGDILLIVNEDADGSNQAYIGTMPDTFMTLAVPQAATSPSETTDLPPVRTRDRVLPLPPHATPDLRLGIARAIEPSPDPEVGEIRTFWTSDLNTNLRYQIEAEALHVGTHCIVWAQRPVVVSATTAQSLGKEFDNTIYELITTNFYEASDVDQNGKITILFVDTDGQAGGYFSPYELYDLEDSNKADMIYIEQMIAQWGGSTYAADVVAHEFTHLVHNNRDDLVEKKLNDNMWMWEGMSTSGEHVYRGFQRDYKSTYNDSTTVAEGLSVTYWDYYGAEIEANYALTYLFHQYLRIQLGQGNAFYRELIESLNNGPQDYDDLIHTYIGEDLDLAQMLTGFRVALITNEKTGLYGFQGETGFTGFERKYWTGNGGNEFYLRGGGALQIRLTQPFRAPKDAEKTVRFIGIHSGTVTKDTREDYENE